MAQGDFFEVRLDLLHGNGQDASARWHYRCEAAGSGAGDADQLDTAFGLFVFVHLVNVVASDWQFTHQFIKNFNDPGDYVDDDLALPGSLGDNCMPPVLGVGMRSPRNDIGVNRASKRLPLGVVEWLGANGIMTVQARDACYSLSIGMGITMSSGVGDAWIPVLLNIEYEDHEISSVTERAELLGQWSFNRWFTTQKSRQSYQWEIPEEPEE